MKLLLLTPLILLIPLQQPQTVNREVADLAVVKFSWSKYRPNSDLIDPGPPLNEPVSLKPQSSRNEPIELHNRRDIQERRAAMVMAEQNGKRAPRQQDYYVMRMEVKNTGQNTIKNIVWEFQ